MEEHPRELRVPRREFSRERCDGAREKQGFVGHDELRQMGEE
jgi:hypothetical protein